MDKDLLEVLGKIAGLAGLSVGLVLLLFREIIRKTVFAALTREHSYRLLRLILILVWSVGIVGIGAWVVVPRLSQPTAPDGPSVSSPLTSVLDLTGDATAVASHIGDQDPLTEGFATRKDIMSAEQREQWKNAMLTKSENPPAWRITNPDTGAVPYLYVLTQDQAKDAMAKGWRITLKARLIRPVGNGPRDPGMHANFDTGNRRFDLNIVRAYPTHPDYTQLLVRLNTSIRKLGTQVMGPEPAIPIDGDRSHKYVLAYHPVTRSASVYLDDGLLIDMKYEGHTDYSTGIPCFMFGTSDAESTFELVRFEIFK